MDEAAPTTEPPGADALVDRLEIGCTLSVASFRGGVASFRRLLAAAFAREGTGAFAPLNCEWVCRETGAGLRLEGGLRLAAEPGGGVCATSSSSVEMNPLEFLRAARYPSSPLGLDGRRNFADAVGQARPALLIAQLVAVAGAIDDLVAAVADAAAGPVAASFWVRQAEFNRDLLVADAPALANAVKREPNPWDRVSRSRHYAATPDGSLDGNFVTVTWPNDAGDVPVRMKFYAKTSDRLRIEVCLDSPLSGAFVANGWRRGGGLPRAVDGSGVAAVVGGLAAACVPVLDAMEAHVAAASGPQLGALELMAALAPLLRATAPPPPRRPGPRPAEATKRDAIDAVFHLLELGRYDASALRTNGTVRKALHRIAAEGGLLAASRGRAALYTVPPSMSEARLALAAALWPEGGAASGSATKVPPELDPGGRGK